MNRIKKLALVMDQITNRTVSGGITFASLAVIVMFILVMAEIVARKALNTTTYISSELCEYCLIVVILFGLADLFKRRQHLSVGIISKKLPQQIHRFVEFIFSITIFLIYSATLTFICFRLVKESYELKVFTASITHTPLWIPQSLIVLGLLILDITLIVEIIKWIHKPEKEL